MKQQHQTHLISVIISREHSTINEIVLGVISVLRFSRQRKRRKCDSAGRVPLSWTGSDFGCHWQSKLLSNKQTIGQSINQSKNKKIEQTRNNIRTALPSSHTSESSLIKFLKYYFVIYEILESKESMRRGRMCGWGCTHRSF